MGKWTKELTKKPVLALIIATIIFVLVWEFDKTPIDAWRTIAVVLITAAYLYFLAGYVFRNKVSGIEKITHLFIALMLCALTVSIIAIPNNQINVAMAGLAISLIAVIFVGALITIGNIIHGIKMMLDSKIGIFKMSVYYFLTVLSITILFSLIYSSVGATQGSIIKNSDLQLELNSFDYLYFSSQVFYTYSFGEFQPRNLLVQLAVMIETFVSFIIHILIIGEYFLRKQSGVQDSTVTKLAIKKKVVQIESVPTQLDLSWVRKNHALFLVLFGFISIIISTGALFSSIEVSNNTNKLIDRQLESIAPQYPELEISSASDDALVLGPGISIMANGLGVDETGATITNFLKSTSYLIVYNRGKLETGRIYLSIESLALEKINPVSDLIQSISGESLKMATLNTIFGYDLNKNGIYKRLMYDYNEGIYDANIVLSCEFCQSNAQRQIFKTTICLWKETSSGCSNFINSKIERIQ